MANIQLPTGKTIYVSTYEWFKLEDKDIEFFFQACVADDLGIFIEEPFSQRIVFGKLDIEDVPDIIDDVDMEEDIE